MLVPAYPRSPAISAAADEVPDPNMLAVTSYDGDSAVFVDSTANLLFTVQRVIAHVAAYRTLMPGDVIHCGRSMKSVDGGAYRGITDWDIRRVEGRPMRIDTEGIGTLSNSVQWERDA